MRRVCYICGSKDKLQESHDVPCYLFIQYGNRKGQKNQSDKLGRHLLCEEHHKEFEERMNRFLKGSALSFSMEYFNNKKEDDSISKI